ncbi:hypothetical protein ZWY2020_029735 [Hordeum vulgare]|nr:hypothetical protein ZWY2020_029735 [Hordeum vulgare]
MGCSGRRPQGKAGEDRVHVVVSKERGWVFVGIYDGFNGPDATDFLVSNLYAAVHRELRGLLWEQSQEDQLLEITTTWPAGVGAERLAARGVGKGGGRGGPADIGGGGAAGGSG